MRADDRLDQGKGTNEVKGALSADAVASLLGSIHSNKPVRGLTHGFYRYPARFSPEFARAVIEIFSQPGDTILDPFMGGGTTVVEGLSLGRKVIGVDVNSLAVFLTRVKSTPLLPSELAFVRRTIYRLSKHPRRFNHIGLDANTGPVFKNTPWWIRNCILVILDEIEGIRDRRILDFLRCGLLKTAQWALDCRAVIPTSRQLFDAFCANVLEMCDHMEEYRETLQSARLPVNQRITSYRRLFLRSAVAVDQDRRIPSDWLPAKLVVTSPPYPGVYMLYHRWKVRGRRETPAIYAILDSPDGHFLPYYTFGGRHRPGLDLYFETLTAAYRSIANLLAPGALVVQLVSFSNPVGQVNRFLAAMTAAGFEEWTIGETGSGRKSRIWRRVPSRKWYAQYRGETTTAKELVLIHRISRPHKV